MNNILRFLGIHKRQKKKKNTKSVFISKYLITYVLIYLIKANGSLTWSAGIVTQIYDEICESILESRSRLKYYKV